MKSLTPRLVKTLNVTNYNSIDYPENFRSSVGYGGIENASLREITCSLPSCISILTKTSRNADASITSLAGRKTFFSIFKKRTSFKFKSVLLAVMGFILTQYTLSASADIGWSVGLTYGQTSPYQACVVDLERFKDHPHGYVSHSDPVIGPSSLYANRPPDEPWGTKVWLQCDADVTFSSFGGYTEHYTFLDTLWVSSCPSGQVYDPEKKWCSSVSAKQKGEPPTWSCSGEASSLTGDPINFSVGNVYEHEVDYKGSSTVPIEFSRVYNSLDGVWRHRFSSHIRNEQGKVAIVLADGREIYFSKVGDSLISEADELGSLKVAAGGWEYTDPNNNAYKFNQTGALVALDVLGDDVYTLTYTPSGIVVSSGKGATLKYTEDFQHQPTSLEVGGAKFEYFYSKDFRLMSISKSYGSEEYVSSYLYEDSRDSSLLTGIVDSRGIRVATWAYDDQKRAISNERGSAVGKVSIKYNEDGSSTVVNELGRSTVYRFISINGVKRIQAIEGVLSPNCSASNSSYTYNDRGRILSKTDAKGIVTSYTYNDRGLETSRTEASGTPLARTITTEWDPDRFLPVRIVEQNRTTVYSYDARGRELTRQTTSH